MTGMSVGTGLVSGMDYKAMISQLMRIEANPQTLLKIQLNATKVDAAAYREINTAFATLGSAAETLTKATTWASTKAASSDASVVASANSSATPGSLTFTVDRLATAHSVMGTTTWAASTDDFAGGSTLTIKSTDGSTTFGTIAITSSDSGPASLDDAVSAINKSGLGLSAAAVKTTAGYVLQVTSTATGSAKAFQIQSDTDATGSKFGVATQGADAQISFANPNSPTAYTSTSPTNTFTGVLPGTAFTVSKSGVSTTLAVSSDPAAVTTAVQSLVAAANDLLAKIADKTDSSAGSTAALKGNFSVSNLADQVRSLVSSAVGGRSSAVAGLQLNKDGTLQFDATAFAAKLTSDPALVQAIFGGTTAVGTDNVANTPDDVVQVDGIAARLKALSERASDSVGGTLTLLAAGRDTHATDLQKQIEAWDVRLSARQATLTKQFTAMETALGTLNSQSSWLSSQLSQLPSWSSSSND